MKVNLDAWFGFWIFMAVYAYCEHNQYMAGHETMLWKHKTTEEKAIQAKSVDADYYTSSSEN